MNAGRSFQGRCCVVDNFGDGFHAIGCQTIESSIALVLCLRPDFSTLSGSASHSLTTIGFGLVGSLSFPGADLDSITHRAISNIPPRPLAMLSRLKFC